MRFVVAVALLFASPVLAQLDRGTITGTITDPTGAAVPSAHVIILHLGTGEKSTTAPNDHGEYSRPGLLAGDYQITVGATGFKQTVRTGIELRVTDTLRVDIRLELGSTSDSVEVTTRVTHLQTDSAEVSTALTSKELVDLPLNFASGRRAELFAYSTAPGVTGDSSTSHINGSASYSKEMLVDGASVTANQGGDYTAGFVSIEALQEVKIQTTGISAEFGRTQGGVFNFVMKSGSNQIHGSAFTSVHNEVFNANTFQNNAAGLQRATDRKIDYAGSLGGPVVIPRVYNGRNRTFFYISHERYKERSFGLSAPNRTEPIPAFYNGDFSRLLGAATTFRDANGNPVLSGAIYDPATFSKLANSQYIGTMFAGNRIPSSRFSKVSQQVNAIASKAYVPTVLDPSGQVALQNNESFPTSTQPIWDRYQYSFKVDQVVNDHHRLAFSGNYQYSPRLILDAGGLWNAGLEDGGPLAKARYRGDTGSLLRGVWDWTISPSVLNNLNISFNHRGNPQRVTQSAVDGAKVIGLAGISTVGYPNINWGSGPIVPLENAGFTSSSYRADTSEGLSDTVSFSKGRHFIKVGWDMRHLLQNSEGSPSPGFTFSPLATAIPGATFAGTYTGYSFASYLLGIVDSGTVTDAVPLGGRIHYYGAFVQDDFKVNSRLTLNLGLRWEFQPPLYEVAGRQSSWDAGATDPASGLKGAYTFAGSCSACTGRNYFGIRDYKNFGPRFGFAWRGPKEIVLRGSYGIVYEGTNFDGFSPTGLGTPTNNQAGGTYLLSASATNPWAGIFNWDNGFPSTAYKAPAYNPSWGNTSAPGMIDPRYGANPYVQQWSFNLQREVMKRTTLDIGYVGNKGTRLRIGELSRVNQLSPAVLAQYGAKLNNPVKSAADAASNGIAYPYPGFTGTVASALRPFPQVQGNSVVTDYGAPLGFSTHHALQVTINREVQKGLSIYANYVLSKTLTNVDSSLAPGNGDNGSRPLDYYNLALEKAPAVYDRPHAVKAYVRYELPFRGRGWMQRAFGNWNVAAIVNYYSGTPLGFTAPSPLSSGWNGAVNRPNIAAGDLMNPAFNSSNFNLADTKSAANTYLNKALFSAPAPLTLGTGARVYGSIHGFGTRNEDFSVQKTVPITEKLRFQLRGELLNAFNRHTLGGIQTSFSNASFGQVTSVSGNRQIQISGRLDF